MRMHSPTHPGKVLREFLGDVGVTNCRKAFEGFPRKAIPHSQWQRRNLGRYVTASFRRVRDARWNLV